MDAETERSGVAVVTGAAGDIGRAIANRLLADHVRVVLVDVDGEAGERAAEALGQRATFLRADVTDPGSVTAMAHAAGALGSVRTLVNNAGAARAASLRDTTPDIWRHDAALNVEAAFLCFRALEDALAAACGSVVNIASVNGLAVFGHPAYSAAKAGLIHLTRLIAVEYGPLGIRANAVAPGTVRTKAWEARAAANPSIFEEAARWYPLCRVVDPVDVAEAVGFLAGRHAGAVTGVCLPVDCGLSAGQGALARTFTQSDHY